MQLTTGDSIPLQTLRNRLLLLQIVRREIGQSMRWVRLQFPFLWEGVTLALNGLGSELPNRHSKNGRRGISIVRIEAM